MKIKTTKDVLNFIKIRIKVYKDVAKYNKSINDIKTANKMIDKASTLQELLDILDLFI